MRWSWTSSARPERTTWRDRCRRGWRWRPRGLDHQQNGDPLERAKLSLLAQRWAWWPTRQPLGDPGGASVRLGPLAELERAAARDGFPQAGAIRGQERHSPPRFSVQSQPTAKPRGSSGAVPNPHARCLEGSTPAAPHQTYAGLARGAAG